jgi:hypothetical protein
MTQKLENAKLNLTFSGTISSGFDMFTPTADFSITKSESPTDGEGVNQVNFVYGDSGQLAASGSVTIDLFSSTTDPFGNAMQLATLKYIQVNNTSADRSSPTESDIKITTNGLGFISGTTDGEIVRSDGVFVNAAFRNGWTVTSGSADTITLTNQSSEKAATYEIVVAGTKTVESSSSSSSSEAGNSSSSSSSSST